MTTQTTQTPPSMQYHGRRYLRAVVGMTAATLALLGSVAFWQVRPGEEVAPATTAATRTGTQSMIAGGAALLEPVADAVMYQQWLDRAATARRPVEASAVSDQEMFSLWQQRMSTPAGQPGSSPGG